MTQHESTAQSCQRFQGVFVTWNVGLHSPEEGITDAISRILDTNSDFVSLSLEEIGRTEDMIDFKVEPPFNLWKDVLISELKNHTIKFAENWGTMALFVFVNNDSNISYEFINSSYILHERENRPCSKASVAVTQKINNKEMTIVGNHLECFDENYQIRNNSWLAVCDKMLNDECTIFMGDLNYRIELERPKVLKLIEKGKINKISDYDQLNRAQNEHPKIKMFKEPKINFPPTYKYDNKCDVYDTSPLKRIPSYTDRILVYTAEEEESPENLEYSVIPHRLSDHRPVMAVYQFKSIHS
ncbi:Endonuclease/Exonuclease/phosphatase family protein [Tritrichomonas foetus]|uniref:Endonuclease/Exonuclease/phosphatase family protein n=1 Tax=Tritrichomonas foetus TaxID=1144522 RepID=A0A1J4K8Q8_9EUKA|nr:Endonuclease/Exonuclease/phosphatase family protein [Tritrichomonas foetus]|eukprot:OHT07272.1 Endonuclease/Exonuclease/phosphatase family protein [Tritrichomonas foetus]